MELGLSERNGLWNAVVLRVMQPDILLPRYIVFLIAHCVR